MGQKSKYQEDKHHFAHTELNSHVGKVFPREKTTNLHPPENDMNRKDKPPENDTGDEDDFTGFNS